MDAHGAIAVFITLNHRVTLLPAVLSCIVAQLGHHRNSTIAGILVFNPGVYDSSDTVNNGLDAFVNASLIVDHFWGIC